MLLKNNIINQQYKENLTLTVKGGVSEIVQAQPKGSGFDEIIRELAFSTMITRGLDGSRQGRTIPNEEMEHRIRTWQK